MIARAALLGIGLGLCLPLLACSTAGRSAEVAVISKEHRVIDRDRMGFRLHDLEEGHGFLRVTLRVRLHADQLGERYTVRLRVRNDGPGLVVVDLERTRIELGGEATVRWKLAHLPREGESELALPPGSATTAKLHFDLRGPQVWPLGVPLIVHVPYRVGPDDFEIAVPFVKRARTSLAQALGKVAEALPLLLLAFGFDAATGGFRIEDGEHDSTTLRLIGELLSDGEPARRLEAATRVRR
jgi:hypothetical protein